MTARGVLADTSVLIEYFKGRDDIASAVAQLIAEERLVVTGIVIAELLQGMKNLKEEVSLDDLLIAMTVLEPSTTTWMQAGKIALELRRAGITLPLTDVAIAALSAEHDLSVFTIDSHFAQIPGIRLFQPLP